MELETLRQIYQEKAPRFDPDGFRLYHAAEELTGSDLYCGRHPIGLKP